MSDKDSRKLPLSNPRVLVVEIGMLDEYVGGDGDLSYWTNSVMEVVIGEEAKVSHSYIQIGVLHMCIVAHSLGQAVFDGNIKVNSPVSFGAEIIDQFQSNDLRKKVELHVKKLLDLDIYVEKSM
ncbi:hypothetical protein L1987_72170 [Smallanthus sonchifolius]|uniref:Uncharacterized protein n=1 Tax=Smallanthus sonchifolius TaxID=185202 RepID=A0ACB9AVB2_9ASTR|nr:hypothetical protein L1987_72170 [Smallanthus sonchifolius]